MILSLNLVREIVLSDYKLRYQGSILGFFWSFLKPLLMFGVLLVVFSEFMRFDIPHYPFYLLLGIIIWNFFAEATTSSSASLLAKGGLIKKIYFPKSTIVVSAVLTAALNFFFNFFVFFIILLFRTQVFLGGLLLFCVLFLELFFLSLGISFLVSSLNARLKDIAHIWELLLQAGFWLTPVVYAKEMIPPSYQWLINLNPLAQIIEYARGVLLFQTIPSFFSVVSLTVFVGVVFAIGYSVFRSRENFFAEEL